MTTQQTTKRNRFAEAFREGGNLVGLAGAAGLSLALLNPLPLLVGLVAEAAYLLFVPDSKWYESRLGKRFEEAVRQRREGLKRRTLPLLSPSMQDRFARLEATRVQIYAQAFACSPGFPDYEQYKGEEPEFRCGWDFAETTAKVRPAHR